MRRCLCRLDSLMRVRTYLSAYFEGVARALMLQRLDSRPLSAACRLDSLMRASTYLSAHVEGVARALLLQRRQPPVEALPAG